MTDYTTHLVAMIVAPKGEPVYSERATRIEIQDDAAGAYIQISQTGGRDDFRGVAIDPEEWPAVRDAIERMIVEATAMELEA